MGSIKEVKPCLLFLAAYSKYPEALGFAVNSFSERYKIPIFQSAILPFDDTTYYQATMGADLGIQLSAFKLISPEELPSIKLWTNELEQKFKADNSYPEERPLNMDPGYMNESKVVLATTKDASHRLYLGQGIYGEVTLRFHAGSYNGCEWTYPNYKRQDHQPFFLAARKKFLELRKEGA